MFYPLQQYCRNQPSVTLTKAAPTSRSLGQNGHSPLCTLYYREHSAMLSPPLYVSSLYMPRPEALCYTFTGADLARFGLINGLYFDPTEGYPKFLLNEIFVCLFVCFGAQTESAMLYFHCSRLFQIWSDKWDLVKIGLYFDLLIKDVIVLSNIMLLMSRKYAISKCSHRILTSYKDFLFIKNNKHIKL